jgi:hypothetical protein
VQLCELLGADRYLTGPAGLGYLETHRFRERDIAIDVIDYGVYPEYPQPSTPFDHGVSVLDLMVGVGDHSRTHLGGRFTTIDFPTA